MTKTAFHSSPLAWWTRREDEPLVVVLARHAVLARRLAEERDLLEEAADAS